MLYIGKTQPRQLQRIAEGVLVCRDTQSFAALNEAALMLRQLQM